MQDDTDYVPGALADGSDEVLCASGVCFVSNESGRVHREELLCIAFCVDLCAESWVVCTAWSD